MVDRRKQAEEAKKRVQSGVYTAPSNNGRGYQTSGRAEAVQRYYQNQERQNLTDQYADANRDALKRSEERTNRRVLESQLPRELKDPAFGIESGLNNFAHDYPKPGTRSPAPSGPLIDDLSPQRQSDAAAARRVARDVQALRYQQANPPAPKRYWGQGFNEFTNEVTNAITLGAGGWLQDSQNDANRRLAQSLQNSADPNTRSLGNQMADRANSYDYYTPQFRDSGAGIAANVIGSLLPGQAAFDIAGLATRGIASNLGRTAARGALGGTIYQGGVEAVDAARTGEVDPLQRGLRVGIAAGLGGAADAGLSGLGRFIGRRFPNASNPLADTTFPGQGGTVNAQNLNGTRSSLPLGDARRVPGRVTSPTPYTPNSFTDDVARVADNGFLNSPSPQASLRRSGTQVYDDVLARGDIEAMRAIDPDTASKMAAYEANGGSIADLPPFLRSQIFKRIGVPETPSASVVRQASDPAPNSAAGAFDDYLRNGKVSRVAEAGNAATARNAAARAVPEATSSPKGTTIPGAGRNAPEPKASSVLDNAIPGASRNSAETPLVQPSGAGRNAPEIPTGTRERGVVSSLAEQEKIPQQMTDLMRQNPNSRYNPITNAETVARARQALDADVASVEADVLSGRPFDADKAVKAQMLIDRYNAAGQYEKAVTVADKLATEATKAGQFIQAQSIRDRLTPEGVLIQAKRIEKRVNDSVPVRKQKERVTDAMKADINNLSSITQQMQGTKGTANEVLDILNSKANGEKLTDLEIDQIRKLVQDSKLFIRDATKPVKDLRKPNRGNRQQTRDSLVSYLDGQEAAARAYIEANKNRLNSIPLDIYLNQIVIGAAKMGKGLVKFDEWSEGMIREFGDEIRPQLKAIYNRSSKYHDDAGRMVSELERDEAVKMINRLVRDKGLGRPEVKSLRILATKVHGLSGDARRIASQDLQKILQGIEKPSFLRKVSAGQTIAQLLNPKTQIRNIVGNEIFYRTERLNKLVATPIDIARSKLTKTDRVVTFRTNNQGQFWKNWMEGAKAGWDGVNINGLETQFELSGQAFRGKYNPMTYLEKALGASLRSFDNAAYMRAYNNTLGEMATLDAINSGKKATKQYVENYIRNVDDNIKQLADDYGRYVTFQDNNVVSRGLVSLKRGLNAGQDFGVGDIVLKYPKTPGALLVRALEYSPAGFIRSAVQLNKAWRYAEEGATRQFVESLSRATIGTLGFAGMGYALMDAGVLTTASSRDRDIRTLEQGAGKGAYQVNLSALGRFVKSGFNPKSGGFQKGDQLYTYDWAQPISLAFSIGSEFRKGQEEGKTADKLFTGVAGAAVNSFAGSLNTLTEQSVLSGLKDAAQGYPGQTVSDKLVDILLDIPASFVPTAVNQLRQTGDNTARETYDPNKIQQSLNMVKNRIPGLAQTLPKRYDNLGNQSKVYQDPSLFNIYLNPGKPSRYNPDDVAQDVLQLITDTDDDTLAPRVPQKKLQGVPLTGEQYSELSRLQGLENRERLGKINRDASTSSQMKKTNRAIDKAAKGAKKHLLREFPDLKAEIKANKK